MSQQWTVPGAESSVVVESNVGSCALCGQVMVRVIEDGIVRDVWHPWNVAQACPPEPPSRSQEWQDWYAAGGRTGRPGHEHFRTTPATRTDTR